MSIFGGFTEQMSNIFRVSVATYKKVGKDGLATRCRMKELPDRDPSTFPLARGTSLPEDMRCDYVLVGSKFECVIAGKRRWVQYNELFDEDIMSVNDLIVKVALGGEFDKDLPMYEEDTHVEPESSKASWYHPWDDTYLWTTAPPFHDCSKYWGIVASHIEQNILAHVRPGNEITVHCIPDGQGTLMGCRYTIYINIKKIANEDCVWIDINQMLRNFGYSRPTKRDCVENPTIIFNIALIKD